MIHALALLNTGRSGMVSLSPCTLHGHIQAITQPPAISPPISRSDIGAVAAAIQLGLPTDRSRWKSFTDALLTQVRILLAELQSRSAGPPVTIEELRHQNNRLVAYDAQISARISYEESRIARIRTLGREAGHQLMAARPESAVQTLRRCLMPPELMEVYPAGANLN